MEDGGTSLFTAHYLLLSFFSPRWNAKHRGEITAASLHATASSPLFQPFSPISQQTDVLNHNFLNLNSKQISSSWDLNFSSNCNGLFRFIFLLQTNSYIFEVRQFERCLSINKPTNRPPLRRNFSHEEQGGDVCGNWNGIVTAPRSYGGGRKHILE